MDTYTHACTCSLVDAISKSSDFDIEGSRAALAAWAAATTRAQKEHRLKVLESPPKSGQVPGNISCSYVVAPGQGIDKQMDR